MDLVFKALADPTRRGLLDELYQQDGQTLSALERQLAMTRFGVMKHLKVLEQAGLVVTRRRGREKLHFLNPVPIRLVHDRWVSKYAEPWVTALSELKSEIEENGLGPREGYAAATARASGTGILRQDLDERVRE
jgi:DNA-binding transcriptional ArsR family regulator